MVAKSNVSLVAALSTVNNQKGTLCCNRHRYKKSKRGARGNEHFCISVGRV